MINIEIVLAISTKNKRICPRPKKWHELYELLPNKKRREYGWEPALPLILAAWLHTSASSKMTRFHEHIEWAAINGSLDEVNTFLQYLPEEEWHHLDD